MKLTNVTYVPTTETSWPFGRAAIACDFDRLGYVEKEYFFSGLARIYQELPHGKAGVIFGVIFTKPEEEGKRL